MRAGSSPPRERGAISHLAARLAPRAAGSFAAAAMVAPTDGAHLEPAREDE